MNDQKQLLFTVTDGISDEYLAEAAAPRPVFSTHAIKRIAAVAAMMAILLTCLLWNPATENPTPAFAVRVFAAENGEQTVTVGSPPVPIDSVFSTDACEHFFPDDWNPKGFFFRICKPENYPQKYFSEVVIEYNGGMFGCGGSLGDNPSVGATITNDLAVFFDEDRLHPEAAYFCIHGWFGHSTDLKIKLYVTEKDESGFTKTITENGDIHLTLTPPANDDRKLFQTITVRVNVDETGYTLEVTDITMHEQ